MKLLKFIKNFSIKSYFALFILLGLSIMLGSYNILLISFSIILLNIIFKPVISNKIFNSKLLILTLITFCYFSLLQCTILFSWIINKSFPLDNSPLLLALIIVLIYLYNYFFVNKKITVNILDSKTKVLSYQDVISVILSFMICAVIFIAPIRESSGNIITNITLSLVNGNVDDAAHLAMVNDHIQFNRGVLFESDAIKNTRSQGFYPTGWHSITAVIIKMINPSIQVGIESLLAYGLQKLFWFFVLFYLLIRSTFITYRLINNKKLNKSSIFFISAFTTMLGCILLIPMLREGFYSFIPQLITTILTLMLLTQITYEDDNKHIYRLLPLLFIVGIGGCLSWLLPLPAFFLAILFVIFSLIKDKDYKIVLKNIFKILKDNIIVILLISSAVIIQLIVMLNNNSSESVSLSKGLTLNGGIVVYSYLFQVIICIGILSYLIHSDRKSKNSFKSPLSLILSLILFCSLIGLIQMAYSAKVDYYFYKIFDILIIAILPFCIVGIDQIIKKINQSEHILIPGIIITGVFLLLLPEISIFPYSAGYRHLSSDVNRSLYNELKNDISEENYFNKKFIFYYTPGSDNYFGNEVANYIAKSNEMNGTCFFGVKNMIWDSPEIEKLIVKINDECKGYSIDIITNSENYQKFNDANLSSKLDNAKINIKHY